MNNEHHAGIFLTLRNGRTAVVVRKRVGEVVDLSPPVVVSGPGVTLGVSCDGARYAFWCEHPERTDLGVLSARLLSPEIAHEGGAWSGMYVGLYSSGNGHSCRHPADFDRFEYRGTDEGRS
jgi:hypothetical protein